MAITMLLLPVLSGCGGAAEETSATTASSATVTSATTSSASTESTTETTETTPAPTPTPTAIDPTVEGTMWYYEDFEGYEPVSNSAAAAKALGWSYNMSSDAQYATNTAAYSIVDQNGSRQFYIKNNTGSSKDSFITVLSDRRFTYLHQLNYTYQYDLTYADAANGSRYIAMVSEYNGSAYYNSCHIRNSGYGNNEVYDHGTWKAYDYGITSKGGDSIAATLLGETAGKNNLLKGISLSIRYAVNWERGNQIYIRVNTEGYPGSGKWTLVSHHDPEKTGRDCLDPLRGGAALAIKTGGPQNGYIDNIVVWCGNGEEPTDKSAPFLSSTIPCHQLIEVGGDKLCALCGKNEAAIAEGWLHRDLPRYEGGVYSDVLYLNGQGIDPAQPADKEGKMQIVSCTDAEDFAAYDKALTAAGYAREYAREADGNLFRSYTKGTQRVYTYLIAAIGEARIITEDMTVSRSLSEFGYTYTPAAGEASMVYQYALPLRDATHVKANGFVDRGMLYVIKLADNSVILVDGGESTQFPPEQVDNLMSFLREITGVGETGKVKIATWYLTHGHGDHYQGFALLLKKYHADIDLERVMYNIPSSYSDNSTITGQNWGIQRMLNYIKSYYGDIPFLKTHTGQVVQLADVTIEVLYTHEDLVDPNTGATEVGTNYNEASMVSKITWGGGKTFLLTGDIDSKAASITMENWKPDSLRVDVIQIAHHVLNDLSDFYHVTQAPVMLVPQSLHRIKEHSVAPTPYSAARKYVKSGMCYFQNEDTVGLGVTSGKIEVLYRRPVVYLVQPGNW